MLYSNTDICYNRRNIRIHLTRKPGDAPRLSPDDHRSRRYAHFELKTEDRNPLPACVQVSSRYGRLGVGFGSKLYAVRGVGLPGQRTITRATSHKGGMFFLAVEGRLPRRLKALQSSFFGPSTLVSNELISAACRALSGTTVLRTTALLHLQYSNLLGEGARMHSIKTVEFSVSSKPSSASTALVERSAFLGKSATGPNNMAPKI